MSAETVGPYLRSLINRFPGAPTRQLSRIAIKEKPGVFRDEETARTSLRYYRGASGDNKRARLNPKHASLAKDWAERKKILAAAPPPSPPQVPEEPFIIPEDRLLILNDVHLPFTDRVAYEAAVEYGARQGVNAVLLNGDFFDFYAISRFSKDVRERGLAGELRLGFDWLLTLRSYFGKKVPIYFRQGNHDERWCKHISSVSPELFGTKIADLATVLKHPALFYPEKEGESPDITFIPKRQFIKYGYLLILHGHEVGRGGSGSPVNAARGIFMKTYGCCYVGHWHQRSEHSERSIDGKVINCWSGGALCQLSQEYMQIAPRWNHGVAIASLTDNRGNFKLDNRSIIDGEVF